MKKIKVDYQGGESRVKPGMAVDYMLAVAKVDGKDVELYAELDAVEGDEDANFDALKADIMELAQEMGLTSEDFSF